MTHELKILPNYFADVYSGIKTFELRINDRDYKVGDTVLLKEYDPNMKLLTGKRIKVEITYLITNPEFSLALKKNFCVFGFRIIEK